MMLGWSLLKRLGLSLRGFVISCFLVHKGSLQLSGSYGLEWYERMFNSKEPAIEVGNLTKSRGKQIGLLRKECVGFSMNGIIKNCEACINGKVKNEKFVTRSPSFLDENLILANRQEETQVQQGFREFCIILVWG